MSTIEIANTRDRILRFLTRNDRAFEPPLSSRVDIARYSTKLSTNATNMFLCDTVDGTPVDVGHCAIYANDAIRRLGFISSICVALGQQKRGFGRTLLCAAEEYAREASMTSLELEVHPTNENAVHFYKNRGFVLTGDHGDVLRLRKKLADNNPSR